MTLLAQMGASLDRITIVPCLEGDHAKKAPQEEMALQSVGIRAQ